MIEMTLRNGKVATMSELQDAFESVLESINNVENPRGRRKALKQLPLREIPEIECHAPNRVNESERVSIKKTRDEAIQMTEDQTANIDADMKILFHAAAIIGKSITKCRKWKFTGSLETSLMRMYQHRFLVFYRWIIAELSRARSGAPWVRKFGKLSIRQKFGYDVAYAHPYTHFM